MLYEYEYTDRAMKYADLYEKQWITSVCQKHNLNNCFGAAGIWVIFPQANVHIRQV